MSRSRSALGIVGLTVGVLAPASVVVVTGAAARPSGMLYGILLIYATMFASGIVAVTHRLRNRLQARTGALKASEQRYRSLFTHNPHAVFTLHPDGRFTSINDVGARLVGFDAARLIGRDFRPFVAPGDRSAVEQRFHAALAGQPQQYEVAVLHADGTATATWVTNFPLVVDGQVVGVHGVLQDISDQKALEQRLIHAAAHDALTGLANRAMLADRLRHALDAATRTGEPVALLVLDLDGFKPVNDTHGHATGDALLVEMVARLADCYRPGDTFARIGGDEFALLLPGADRSAAVGVAERMLEVVAHPVTIGDITLSVSVSIGVAVSTVGSDDGQLLRDADVAMYAAKRRGRDRHAVFDATLEQRSTGALRIRPSEARAWAHYMTELRAEIARRKDAGELPAGMRAPASAARALESLLAAIDVLPAGVAVAELALPAQTALEEFVFHQTMVHDWADRLVDRQLLTTRRPPAADRFWSDLHVAVVGDARVGHLADAD